MKLIRTMPALFIALLATVTAAFSQEETRIVSSEGVAVIQNNLRDIARDAAIQDAQQRAVEQAIGTLIDSQTQVENYQVISDRILSQTKGYIRNYTITKEIPESNLLRVAITAEVSLAKLTDDLSAIGMLLAQMHKPRTIILVAEQNVGQEIYAWWRSGGHADLSVVENVLMDKFCEKGFPMIDHATASGRIAASPAYAAADLSAVQAQTLGGQAGAEVAIIGKAVSRIQGVIGGLRSAQADISLKAVRIDTGQVLASATANAPAVHTTDLTAGNEALKKAAAKAADQLTEKILAAYSKESGGTRPVNITITGLSKSQFVRFKDMLKNQVRGIKDIHERSFNNGIARISIDYKGSAQVLSDELSSKNFSDFTVNITASTANTLELTVLPK